MIGNRRASPLLRTLTRSSRLTLIAIDAIEMDSVAVVDAHPDRWMIRFADPAIIAIHWVDAATRHIVSYEVTSRKTNGKARKVYQGIS
jgi:hypothetical protein